jgi:hypothetical protein
MRTHLVVIALALAACGTDAPTEPPVFPADYASTYQEVRNCRYSLEHDSMYIRVLASPTALAPYMNRTAPFPTGAVVVKEEYGITDTTCSQGIKFWTVMEKLEDATSPSTLDWHWQRVDKSRHTSQLDGMNCLACHMNCLTPPDGYDYTCTMP